jgi:hypothetical protein
MLILSVKKNCIKNPFQGLTTNLNILKLTRHTFRHGVLSFFLPKILLVRRHKYPLLVAEIQMAKYIAKGIGCFELTIVNIFSK